MTSSVCRPLLAASLMAALCGPASATPIGLTVSNGELVTVDLENGASDPIVLLEAPPTILSLDTAPDGTLFGLELSGPTTTSLLRIHRATGATTRIGDVGSQEAIGLAFDEAGRLFVADGPTLLEVDPTTASTSPVLDMGIEAWSLVADNGDLYAIRFAPSSCELVLLEPDLGNVTQVLPDVPCARSADGGDGILWLANFFSPITGLLIVETHRLDLASGMVDAIGLWSGLPGSHGFVAPTSLADIGNPSLLPTVDIPTLDGRALAL
ncbi:MAG: hypothetical protein AAF657_21445, partial [Acidobacteriota bacterium]